MKNKISEIQNYLKEKGIKVPETAIINAAIKIATRRGGNWVFVCEFREKKKR